MSYGTKYYSTIGDFSGNTFVVNLKLLNYSGSTTEIEHYNVEAIRHNYRGGVDEINNSVHGSEVYFSFYVEEGQGYDDLLESNYKDWQLEILRNGVVYWIGWVKPENITRPFIKPAYFLSLSAICGLADLKQIEFPAESIDGRLPLIDIIKIILSNIGIELPILAQTNIRELLLMDEDDIVLSSIRALTERFVKVVSGKNKYTNCYDALDQILTPLNARICQANGAFQIFIKNEIDSRLHTYDYTALTATTTNYDRTVDISNFYLMAGTDELSKLPPLKRHDLTLYNRNLGTNVLFNGDFTTTSSGWTNGSFNNWGWSNQYGGTLRVHEENIEEGDNYYFTSQNFSLESLTPEEDKVIIKMDVRVANIVFADINIKERMPYLETRLAYPDGTTFGREITELSEGLRTYTHVHHLSQTGTYNFRVTIRTGSDEFDEYEIFFDNISVTQDYYVDDVTFDKFYSAEATGSTAVQIANEEIYFGDSFNSNDAACLSDLTTGLTSTWINYNSDASQFANYTFSGGSISPWVEVGTGTAWTYLGGISNDVRANGTNSSKVLMQSDFRPGRYTIHVTAKNDNTVSSGFEPNGYVAIYTYDGTNLVQLETALVTRAIGYATYEFKIQLFETIDLGFRVFRAGPGSHLDMSVSEIEVVSFTSPDYATNIQKLLLYNRMVASSRFKNYLRFVLKSANDIHFNNALQIGDDTYQIINYSNDLKNNRLELGVYEHLSQHIDVVISTVELNTVDGIEK